MKKHLYVKILFLLVATFILLPGCSKIPISTMLKMRNFGVDDVVKLDPNDIRVMIEVEERVVCDPNGVLLKIEGYRKDGKIDKLSIKMEQYDFQKKTIGIIFKDTLSNYYYKVTNEGIADFVKLQNSMQKKKLYKSSKISATASISNKDLDELEMSIYLKLYKGEDFFPLIDRAKFKLNKMYNK